MKQKIRISFIMTVVILYGCVCACSQKETIAELSETEQNSNSVGQEEITQDTAKKKHKVNKDSEEKAVKSGKKKGKNFKKSGIPQQEDNRYIAVPLEYMSMRTNPGFGDDVVVKIAPETMLLMVGDSVKVDDKTFYYMQTMDGSYKGYCAAEYCIKVSYDYNDTELTIVDTDHALYSYSEMEQDLEDIAETYADCITVDVLGESVEGRNIYRAILGNPNAQKRILIQAGIHGREYMSCQQVMKMLEYYAANYENGYYEDVWYSDLFKKTALHIVPMSNPDGVSISQQGEDAVFSSDRIAMMRSAYERDKETLIHAEDAYGNLYWYDTYKMLDYDRYEEGYNEIISYEEYLKLWKANANGVDLNRNFDAGWEDINQKEEPGSEFFKGYYKDSEPETIILKNLIQENDYTSILNYHAKGQWVYYDVEGNSEDISKESKRLAKMVKNLNQYQLVNCKDEEDAVLGGLGDWAMLKHETPSITIEIGKKPCPLGSEEFSSIWNRGREVWAKVMKKM